VADKLNLTGDIYGQLTVLREVFINKPNWCRSWLCLCVCGKETIVQQSNLRSGHTTSCGCLKSTRVTTHGHTKGKTPSGARVKSKEYRAWCGMLARCNSPTHHKYKDYGERGISVGPEWFSFEVFYSDMGGCPSNDHSLDRVDNSLGYCKENCRWATRKEQMRNRRISRKLTFQGRSLCVAEWAETLGIPGAVIFKRLRMGWSTEDCLLKPISIKHQRF